MLACGLWTKRLCSLNNIFYLYILICILVYWSVTLIFCITIRAEFVLQQTWLLPFQPLSEEAQLWEMQKRGISLAGGHELFQLYHLLGVHSATLLPLPSLWIGWWGGEAQSTQNNDRFDFNVAAKHSQSCKRQCVLRSYAWYANVRWLDQNAPQRASHFIRFAYVRQHV